MNKKKKHSKFYGDALSKKKEDGVYYTMGNPFQLEPFKNWARKISLKNLKVLEPFAGKNHIIRMLKEAGFCKSFQSYDISPKDPDVQKKDTLKAFPKNYEVCITNPPWLASYAARRLGLKFPTIQYDNIYKHCLEIVLNSCDYVAFIIPGTFLVWAMRTPEFKERLDTVIFINSKIFMDTENPVCLALFVKEKVKDTKIFNDKKRLGTLKELESYMPPKVNKGMKMVFNSDRGNLGVVCFDNTAKATIRFCPPSEIKRKDDNGIMKPRKMKISDRHFTKIKVNKGNVNEDIQILNKKLEKIRKNTHDVFFAPYKGLRKDGNYRRRIDFLFVRNLINSVSR